jgi:hypothetical protein
VKPEKKEEKPTVEDYKEYHTDTTVHFEVRLLPPAAPAWVRVAVCVQACRRRTAQPCRRRTAQPCANAAVNARLPTVSSTSARWLCIKARVEGRGCQEMPNF